MLLTGETHAHHRRFTTAHRHSRLTAVSAEFPLPAGGLKLFIGGLLAVWLAAVVWLGTTGVALAARAGTPPLPIGIGFAAPIALFFKPPFWLVTPFSESSFSPQTYD